MRKIFPLIGLLFSSTPAWADGTIDTLSAGSPLAGTELLPMFQSSNPAVTTTPNAIATFLTGKTNTWSAAQTFNNSDILLLGSSTGKTTFTSANAGASNFTLTIPAATDTIDLIGTAQSITAAKTFSNSAIKLLGSSTGATTFTSANSGASNFTITVPAVTDTLAALATAQTWTAAQTFTNSDIKLLGSSTGATTLTSANSGASNFTLTLPAATDTLAVLATAQTWSAAQTFSSGDLKLAGATSGTTTLNASATASGTVTVPAVTDTLAVLATAQTWSAAQTFNSGDFKLAGSGSGTTTINAAATASGTVTIPAVTDTLAAIGTAQTWTAIQTFTNSDLKLLGSSTGATTFTSANAGASNFTITVPAATDTLDLIGTAQTFTAAKTFTNSDLLLLGSSTGATTFTSANSGASNFTLTIPANTGTLAELNLAQSFTATQTFATIGGYKANIGTQSGTSCTLADGSSGCGGVSSGDCGIFITFSSNSTVTVTLPNSLPAGCQVALTQNGTGSVTLSAASGATLNSPHSFTGKTAGQFSTIGVTVETNSGGSSAVYKLTGDAA